INIATVAIKRHQPNLFANDQVFGASGRWRFHTPLHQALLEMILVPSGYQDLTLPFRAIAGVVAMIYLCGMYALLYRQCRSWSISTFVAVLSSAVVYTFGRSTWGVGSLSSITAWTLYLAVCPLIVLALLRHERQWKLILVFGFIGLLGNIHLVAAMNLTIVLLIVYLVRRRFAPAAWAMAVVCGLCALLAVGPYLWYCFKLRGEVAVVSMEAVREALQVADVDVLYPDILRTLKNWFLFAAVLGVPAAVVLPRVERFRVRDLSAWVSLAVGGLFVAFGLHAVSQLIGDVQGKAPPVIDFFHAASLVMLPLYVLFAQALTNIFRMVRTHRSWLRWLCAALMAAWIIPSDNFRLPRHAALDKATMFMKEADKPRRVRKHHDRIARRAELERVGQWARYNTDRNAVFLVDLPEFRMLSRRAIAACTDDLWYAYHLAPARLAEWTARIAEQRALLYPPTGTADLIALQRFADKLAATEMFEEAEGWFVVLRADVTPEKTTIEEIEPDGWGRFYRIYRLR
ncbi:MAG: hypothetical protein KAU28_11310, partial [Phycisphaerae bacterium]|nr:hypothetical protein [Phycisphaerae bacterium]